MFNLWVTKVVQDFDNDFKDQWSLARSGFDAGVMLKWDTIEISEQAEDGTEVKSKIKVPQNLSLPTWQSLMQFCQKAYKIGAHSLPNIIHQGLSSKAVNAAVKVIQDLAKDKLTQNFALQFYFDIQFLSLISPEDCVQEAFEALENHSHGRPPTAAYARPPAGGSLRSPTPPAFLTSPVSVHYA